MCASSGVARGGGGAGLELTDTYTDTLTEVFFSFVFQRHVQLLMLEMFLGFIVCVSKKNVSGKCLILKSLNNCD